VLIWWNQILHMSTRPTSWRGMKDLMRHCFVPEHYKRDMYNKLQLIRGGLRTPPPQDRQVPRKDT
jgi:hypothetical protein